MKLFWAFVWNRFIWFLITIITHWRLSIDGNYRVKNGRSSTDRLISMLRLQHTFSAVPVGDRAEEVLGTTKDK